MKTMNLLQLKFVYDLSPRLKYIHPYKRFVVFFF